MLIKSYEDARCTNFASNKAAFIASSLSRTRRSIILDRVMTTDQQNNTILVTDLIRIKEIANTHFQTIAGAPPARKLSIQDMSEYWQSIYNPDDSINAS